MLVARKKKLLLFNFTHRILVWYDEAELFSSSVCVWESVHDQIQAFMTLDNPYRSHWLLYAIQMLREHGFVCRETACKYLLSWSIQNWLLLKYSVIRQYQKHSVESLLSIILMSKTSITVSRGFFPSGLYLIGQFLYMTDTYVSM